MKNIFTTIICIIIIILFSNGCTKETNSAIVSSDNNFSKTKATTFTSNEKQPLDEIIFVPCANGGKGENVHLTGTIHILIHTTVNGNNFIAKFQLQPQGVKGKGEITGLTYVGNGAFQQKTSGSFNNGKSISSFINNFNLIGKGDAVNYRVHNNIHTTINANGTATASVDNFKSDCK